MIEICNKVDCCGCTACASVCPKQCIVMKPDEEGFLYPEVNKAECVGCELCVKSCPVINHRPSNEDVQGTYAVRAMDEAVVKDSTSGGVFTPLAMMVLQKGGVICAAGYDVNFQVVHQFIDGQKSWHADDLKRFRGSKYVQSNLKDCYSHIRTLLTEGREVCFVGTPCQVYGLKHFLQKEYAGLLTVDLVCHGVPSPEMWAQYLEHQKQKYRAEIQSVCFRSKRYGYHSGGFMKIGFSNGKTYLASARIDPMLKCFFAEIASRPICYQCPFKQKKHCSDLTIYDCWSYGMLTNKKDDDLGYTNVMVQSFKGGQTLQAMSSSVTIIPVDTAAAIDNNGSMVENCPQAHSKRPVFYQDICSEELGAHVQQFLPVTWKDYAIEYGKRLIYQFPFLRSIRQLVK